MDARTAVFEWAAEARLPGGRVPEALRLAGVTPDVAAWRQFIDRLLISLGVIFFAAGAIFFVAANWHAMSRFAKLGLIEVPIVAAIALCAWRGLDARAGKAALLAAALLTGALLALVGQIYQTGADTYELFAAWALAIAAWVAVARMPALWLLWLGIVNLAIGFYFAVFPNLFGLIFGDRLQVLWALFAFDAAALGVWELAASRGIEWLRARWAMRVLAAAAGATITALAILYWTDFGQVTAWTMIAYGAWVAATYWAYRRQSIDLFILAGGVLSVALVAAALSLRLFRSAEATGFLLTGLLVSGIATLGAQWLRRVAADGHPS